MKCELEDRKIKNWILKHRWRLSFYHWITAVKYETCEICDKNISKEKYEKLRNYLKWKNSVKLFLERGSLPL